MTLSLSGGILSDVVTWVRRIIKSPSDQAITDQTIGDYINRFYVYDMPERIQLFELTRQYTFETIPNVFEYQYPYPNYQTVRAPAYCDGVQLGYFQSNEQFYNLFPELVQNEVPLLGDGGPGPYNLTVSRTPILRGFTDDLGNLLPYVYVTAIDNGGEQVYVVDDGNGNLIQTDSTFQFGPNGAPEPVNIVGTVDYVNGVLTDIVFANSIPGGNNINVQTSPYSPGFPRIMLFFNNIFKLYPVPDRPYKIQIDTHITPAAFLSTDDAVPFAYMSEYLARGAARKILSDNADYDMFQFYEPLFREQENLVLRRTSRQNATQRTPTIFSSQNSQNPYFFTQY